MAVGLVGAAFASNFFSLAVAQLAIGFAFGLCYPLFMGFSVSNADPHNRSTAMGLFQAVYAIGMSAGPAFSTWMAERTSVPIMMATVGIIIVVFGGAVLQLYAHFTDQKVIQKISRD